MPHYSYANFEDEMDTVEYLIELSYEGKFQEVVDTCLAILKRKFPNHRAIKKFLIEAYCDLGQIEKAMKWAVNLYSEDPTSSDGIATLLQTLDCAGLPRTKFEWAKRINWISIEDAKDKIIEKLLKRKNKALQEHEFFYFDDVENFTYAEFTQTEFLERLKSDPDFKTTEKDFERLIQLSPQGWRKAKAIIPNTF